MNKARLQEHEDRVLTEIIWHLTMPGSYVPDEISTPELITVSKSDHSRLYGMTEQEIRNATRRLKKKGMIKRSWQRMNPDQPSGEYGEVWNDEPFIPHHGYAPTGAALKSESGKKAVEMVNREWEKSVKMMLTPETKVED